MDWNLTDIRPAPYDHIVELRPIKWNILGVRNPG